MSGPDLPARLLPLADPASSIDPDLLSRIQAQRGRVSALYGTLLHSPTIAEGWLHFLTAVRRDSSLPPALRELVILRVAVLNGAPYEFEAHRHHAEQAGLSAAQIDALASGDIDGRFDATTMAVVAYTDAMTRTIEVPDPVYAAVRAAFSDRELVELTATIGAYNLVSRFLVALRVGATGGKPAA
ncbi:MAG: carboxymuconolactone decarboxylase family protein [bacterium]|jgi:AhpD family alkylhydroperoxidase